MLPPLARVVLTTIAVLKPRLLPIKRWLEPLAGVLRSLNALAEPVSHFLSSSNSYPHQHNGFDKGVRFTCSEPWNEFPVPSNGALFGGSTGPGLDRVVYKSVILTSTRYSLALIRPPLAHPAIPVVVSPALVPPEMGLSNPYKLMSCLLGYLCIRIALLACGWAHSSSNNAFDFCKVSVFQPPRVDTRPERSPLDRGRDPEFPNDSPWSARPDGSKSIPTPIMTPLLQVTPGPSSHRRLR